MSESTEDQTVSRRIAELEEEVRAARTARDAAVSALQSTEDRFRVFFNHLLDVSLVIDAESGRILDANTAALANLRYDREELLGQHFTILFPRADARSQDRDDLLEQLHVHGHVFEEQQFCRGDGDILCADLSAVMLRWGGQISVLLSLRDTTERKRAERKRLEGELMRTKLETISQLNHEINNPLQELLTRVELDGDDRYRVPVLRIAEVLKRLRDEEAGSDIGGPPSAGATPSTGEHLEDPIAKRLLVVDDEKHIRELFRRALGRAFPDMTVDIVSNGREALEVFSEKHHPLVLLDVEMPVMRGDEAFNAIAETCQLNGWQMPVVVFCTGFNLPLAVRSIVESSDLHVCMLKPVNIQRLREVVEERLELASTRAR